MLHDCAEQILRILSKPTAKQSVRSVHRMMCLRLTHAKLKETFNQWKAEKPIQLLLILIMKYVAYAFGIIFRGEYNNSALYSPRAR